MRQAIPGLLLPFLICNAAYSQQAGYELPIPVGVFEQQVHRAYTTAQGLPDNDVSRVGAGANGVGSTKTFWPVTISAIMRPVTAASVRP